MQAERCQQPGHRDMEDLSWDQGEMGTCCSLCIWSHFDSALPWEVFAPGSCL